MLYLRNTPLRRKLRLLMAVPGAAAVLLVGLVTVVRDDRLLRAELLEQVQEAVTRITPRITEELALEEPSAEALEIFHGVPGIAGAVVWGPDQEWRLLEVGRVGSTLPNLSETRPGYRFERRRLVVWQPVVGAPREALSTLVVSVDLRRAQQRLWNASLYWLLLVATVGVGLWFLAGPLGRSIHRPVASFLALQEKVEKNHTFSHRARVETDDEFARLVEGYHHLLVQVEARDEALLESRERETEAQRLKGLYLAGVSHELRTPLMSILSYGEALTEEDGLAPELRKDVEHLRAAGNHLIHLIDQILDLSRLEAGRTELELGSIAIRDLVLEVAATAEPLVQQKGNVLEVRLQQPTLGEESLGVLQADLTRCRQVLLNLLANAAAFTRDGWVRLEAWREPGPRCDRVAFQVTDNGIGIPPEQMQHLFEPFTRGRDESSGAGLGLALSRRFARLMGGDITVASEPGHETAFLFRLPVEVLPAGEDGERLLTGRQEGSAAATTHQRPRALLIDDDPDAAEVLEAMLQGEGYQVHCFSEEEAALRWARREPPALITLEVKAPQQRGWRLLARLKAEPALRKVPVLVVSRLQERAKALDLGAAELLVKPFDRKRLSATLARIQQERDAPVALVVEDEVAVRGMLRRILERVGWRVTEADNGVTALRQVIEHQPRFILLDLVLPELDGFAFLRELRKTPEGRAIAVVVVTGRELSPDEERSLGPVEGILVKGAWTLEELRQEIRNLSRARLSHES